MKQNDRDELGYLRQIELLAMQVAGHAYDEDFMTGDLAGAVPDPPALTPFQRAVQELVAKVRWWHFDDDGCIEEDGRSIMSLSGLLLIGPHTMPEGWHTDYSTLCERFGVAARDEGWALWHTWDKHGRAHTLVTTNLTTTRGLLDNWSRGRDMHPLQPEPGQVAATIRGWHGPAIVSPGYAARLELVDRSAMAIEDDGTEVSPRGSGSVTA